jgi:MFS family permease
VSQAFRDRGGPRGPLGAVAFGQSREIWLVQVGIFLNMLGYGAVLPFEIIYLHTGRGFSLGTAGLIVGTITGVAIAAAPLAGPLIDRYGARLTAAAGGLALAAGYAGLAFAHTPGLAFAAAAIAGVGNGGLNPSQSALLATLARPDQRHRATAISRVAGNAGIGIGGALGGLAAAVGLTGFVVLFLVNAVTYLLYVGVLAVVVREDARPDPVPGGYLAVLRDGAFVRLAVTNVGLIAVGWGVFTWLLPPYARSEAGIGPALIGLLLLANAFTVVVAQVPIARLAEGRRRVTLMAVAGGLFAGACLLVITAGASPAAAYPVLLAAAVAVGFGESCHTTALMPLAADLAPAGLRGRYLASMGFSWWIGLALAPTLGGQVLSRSPDAAFAGAAFVAVAAAGSALRLERRLPAAAVRTPTPDIRNTGPERAVASGRDSAT